MDTKAKVGAHAPRGPKAKSLPGQIVFVLQGGGALGAYQAGVYQALHEAGIEPDWIIGTSIGAINGAIIAGNNAKDRLARLRQFWDGVAYQGLMEATRFYPGVENTMLNLATLTQGIRHFFKPNPDAWRGPQAHLGVERAAYYSADPLRETLSSLVDFDYLNAKHMRLTVGTVKVKSGKMSYFTNRDLVLGMEHVMASAAIPPAFPAVRIDGEAYWDGGIYSNTPLEAVLDDFPRRNSVIFAVQMWPAEGPEPETLWQVMGRERDIQYSSRAESHLARQRQIHRLRHVIRELERYIPQSKRALPDVKELLSWGCHTSMHVVELNAPSFSGEDPIRDLDFTTDGIEARWAVGYAHARRAIELAPWREEMDPIEGIAVHGTHAEFASEPA
jgi:NTE family protein